MRSMTNVLQDISPSGIIRPVIIASALIWFIIHLCIHGFYVCSLQFLHNVILYRYIMFGRGICEKYQSIDEKFPEPNGE
jgi:hypothetical protein